MSEPLSLDAARERYMAHVQAAENRQTTGGSPDSRESGSPPVELLPERFEIELDDHPITTVVITIDGERKEYPVYPLTVKALLSSMRCEERMRYWTKRANETDDEKQGEEWLAHVRELQRKSLGQIIPQIPTEVMDRLVKNAGMMLRLNQFASKIITSVARGNSKNPKEESPSQSPGDSPGS